MKEQEIKSQIKKLANEFNLQYKPEWFDYLWISKRDEILTEYVGDCPDPIYQKYGKNPEQRIKNFDKFVNSQDFQKCIRRYGGQVTSRKNWKKEKKLFKQIKNKHLREELLNLHNKIKKRFDKTDQLALMTKTNIKKEYDWLMRYCLRHEWIHILLDKNKIQFQEVNKKYWPYDEGINEYMAAFLDGNLSKLEKLRDKENYPMEHKNWVYAIKIRGLFENKNSPREKHETILRFINKLKKINK